MANNGIAGRRRQAGLGSVGWSLVVVVLAAILWVIVLVIHGFAFTPLWSAAFAAWFLVLLTLLLHLLVSSQGDPGTADALDTAPWPA